MADTPETTRKAVTVLVVEDSPTQLEELRFLLAEAGYSVVTATNGKEGLAAAKANAIDLVLSDIVMPEMDGYALCKALRADETLPRVPVILLTSLADPRDVIKGLESGANNFVCKPYDDRGLLARVQNVLTNREIRTALTSEMGISIFFAGQPFFITADRLQILDLLLSTYESAVSQNAELIRTQDELRSLNEGLEGLVAERTAALTERINELKCLHAISNVVVEPCKSIDETLKAVVDLIPLSWQSPEIACARIVLDGRMFASANFRETVWKQSAEIVVSGETVGTLEVCYLEEGPALDQRPSFKEKRDLIAGIAMQLAGMIERTRTQQALRASEEQLRFVADHAPVFIAHCDRERRYRFVNQPYAGMFGLRPADIVGKHTRKVLGEEAYALASPHMEAALAGQPAEYDLVLPATPGGLRVVHVSHAPERDASGRVVGFVAAVVDITERKRAEEKLARLNRQHELILSSAAEGILGLDSQGNHTFVNPAAARMLGYEVEQLLGRPSHSAWHYAKPDGSPYPREECPIYAAFRDGAVHRASTEVFWRKDGTRFPVEYASTPIYEQGQLAGAVVTFADITERKRAEEKIKGQLEELQRWQDVTLGREDRVLEVKKEVNELLARLGQPPRYLSVAEGQNVEAVPMAAGSTEEEGRDT